MTDEQTVAIVAAILFAGDGIESRVADVSDALTHDAHDWIGIGFDEAVARARDLLALAQTPTVPS